jgi:PAS domain S-box-containing protein
MKDPKRTKQALLKELAELQQHFEEQVQEKTREFMAANEQLRAEISRRKELERHLKDSEERYRSIFDNSLDGIFFASPDGSIFAANRSACEMLGRTEQEICDGGRGLVIDNTDPRLTKSLEERAMTGCFLGELNLKRKDGAVFPAELSSTVFALTNGDLRTNVVLRDITKRKRIEKDLLDGEEKYRRIFENQLIAISIADLETLHFLDVNDTHVLVYGYSREELFGGMTLLELSAQPDASYDAIQKAKTIGMVHIALGYHKKKDGTVFPVELVRETHSLKGQPVLIVMVRDITERIRAEEALRNSEQRLALALQATQNAVWDIDMAPDTIYLSPQWWRMLGYEENELESNMDLWFRLMHPEDREPVRRKVTDAMAQHSTFEVESRLLHKKGHYVPVLTQGFILRDSNSNPLRVSGINTDLTEKNRIEEERRQLAKLESLNRMAAAIAHNFNNLHAAVLGNLELAMADIQTGTRLHETITEAMKASRRAADVSSMMLTYLGKTIAQREFLDLEPYLRTILPVLIAAVPPEVMIEADLPLIGTSIHANREQVKEILRCLILNASEAMSGNHGTIRLTAKTAALEEIPTSNRFPIDWQSQAKTYACMEVNDAGCGIPHRDVRQIFDPFFSTKFTGRGLGLAVVLGIVRSHGGVITVESTPGHGSTFRIFFPLPVNA